MLIPTYLPLQDSLTKNRSLGGYNKLKSAKVMVNKYAPDLDKSI